MTCVVRILALEAFTALVEDRIPELAGHTCAGDAPSSEVEHVPNLSIEPSKWVYYGDVAEQVAKLPGNRAVFDVGVHQAECVVSIITTSPKTRAVLEQKVLDLFLAAKHPLTAMKTPGIISMLISTCDDIANMQVTYELDSDQWISTLALDRRYESRILVSIEIPALTIDYPVYDIQQLVLGVQDTTTPTVPSGVELVLINADGSLSPA